MNQTQCETCEQRFPSQGAGPTRKRFCSEACMSRAAYYRNETRWLNNPDGTGGAIGALIESGEAIALVIKGDQLESDTP